MHAVRTSQKLPHHRRLSTVTFG